MTYFEQSGRTDGVPVLCLHGGPGSGLDSEIRRFHDPDHFRLIMFDQRGAGKSLPSGFTKNNSTQKLLEDIELLRSHLAIEKWVVSGGSWGSTLTLAYAQAYPNRCTAIVVRGVFLGTRDETDWIAKGLRRLFPVEWQNCMEFLDQEEQQNLFESIQARISSGNSDSAISAARALSKFEWICSSVDPDERQIERELTPEFSLQYSRLLCHYALNDFFLEPDELIRNIDRVVPIPGRIIQGQFDFVCPPAAAVRLHQAWQGSELVLVPKSGHLVSEPGIAQAYLDTMEQLKAVVSGVPGCFHPD
jgi:proline iminopeptidase